MKTNQEQKKALINSPMSAEEWFYKAHSGYSMTQFHRDVLMTEYANYILSQGIDELAERISKGQLDYVCSYGNCDMPYCDMQCQVVDKKSILKIANDFKTELNLQSSK